MAVIERIDAREILDSRGRPTVEATVLLGGGHVGIASVPSGASTGAAEAIEVRDGDPRRFGGWGCLRAVEHIRGAIAEALVGKRLEQQQELDRALIELDGTPQKNRLGANALLAVSLAFARAEASRRRQPLYQYFTELVAEVPHQLPRPMINLFSGGKHAGGQVSIQDVMVVPHAATFEECLATCFAVYQEAARWCRERYGTRPLKADEGGLAPDFATSEAMLADATYLIARAGFLPGRDISLAMDVAASHCWHGTDYIIDGVPHSANQLIDKWWEWSERFPLVSIEDPLAQDDWESWPPLFQQLGQRLLVIGDDLLCTQPDRIRRAMHRQAANGLLLKVNQIGTLTEAAESRQLAWKAGWHVSVSARSGETEDNWLADLAVAWGHSIKVGSLAQSDRLAKYNRLLAIERQTQWPVCPVAAR